MPEFIRSPPMLAVYDVAHSHLLGGVGRGFLFAENETPRHFSYLSGTFKYFGYKFKLILCTLIFHLISVITYHLLKKNIIIFCLTSILTKNIKAYDM